MAAATSQSQCESAPRRRLRSCSGYGTRRLGLSGEAGPGSFRRSCGWSRRAPPDRRLVVRLSRFRSRRSGGTRRSGARLLRGPVTPVTLSPLSSTSPAAAGLYGTLECTDWVRWLHVASSRDRSAKKERSRREMTALAAPALWHTLPLSAGWVWPGFRAGSGPPARWPLGALRTPATIGSGERARVLGRAALPQTRSRPRASRGEQGHSGGAVGFGRAPA